MSEQNSPPLTVSKTSNTLDRDPLGLSSSLNVSSEFRQRATELWEHWKGNPRDCVTEFRIVLMLQQETLKAPDGRILPEFCDYASRLNMIMSADKLGAGAWSLFIQEGLHSLYIDALLLRGVWVDGPEFKMLLSDLLSGLACCIPYTKKYPDAADEVIRRVPTLLKLIWQRRECFDVKSLDINGFDWTVEPIPEQNVVELLLTFYDVCLHRREAQPTPETYLPQLGAYFWTRVNRREPHIIHLVKLLRFLTNTIPYPEADTETFAEDTLVRAVSADKFIDRANKDLQIADYPSDLTRTIVWVLLRLDKTRCLQVYLDGNTPLPHVITATSRVVADPITKPVVRAAVFTGTLNMFAVDLDRLKRYRGHNAFEFLTRAIDLTLVNDDVSGLNEDDHKCIAIIVHNLASFALSLRHVRAATQRQYLKELEDAARLLWWPNLNRLRIAQLRAGQNGQLNELITWWITLGTNLGLKEDSERIRLKKLAESHCSWQECEFSMTKKEARADLRKCTGCAQARYCGKECQMNDWIKGGHKKICKRLKK